MRINGSMFDPLRPERASAHVPDQAPRPQDATPEPKGSAPAKTDSVQLSDAGRTLAGRLDADSSLDPERVAELRERVLTGAYNSLDVVDQVARRILARGDL